jgi:hypothetical protein
MEINNLLIGHKHGKEISMIKRFLACVYGRELSHVCEYTWALDLTWVRKVLFLGTSPEISNQSGRLMPRIGG